jgi:hypothetical protein
VFASLAGVRLRLGGLHGDAHLGFESAQRERDLDAAELRHVDVEDRDVRPLLKSYLNRLRTIFGFEDDKRLERLEYPRRERRSPSSIAVREQQPYTFMRLA